MLAGASRASAQDEAAPTSAASPEPVVVVELRSGDDAKLRGTRHGLADAVAKNAGLRVLRGPALDTALAGLSHDPTLARAEAAVAKARAAYGTLDCKAATAAATAAVEGLSAVQAKGAKVTDALRAAYAYQLLCADSAADQATAMYAARQLRVLGGDAAPKGVGAAVWKRYPSADAATNVLMAQLTVTSTSKDARVWVDHTPRGLAPVTVVVPYGRHRIAVASASGHASFVHVVKTDKESLAAEPKAQADPWQAVRKRVAAWRKPGGSPSRAGLAALMKDTGVRFAIVLAGNQAGVWGVRDKAPVAKRVGIAAAADTDKLARLVIDNALIFDGKKPEADQPLLVEQPGGDKARKKPQKWWVYASIIGAVVLGAGIIAARDLATDRQRIELTWP